MSLKTAQEMGRPIRFTDEGLPLTSNVASIDTVGAGVTSTNIGDGVTVTVAGGSGTFAYNEVLAGTGTSFTLAHTPNPAGSLILKKNGQLLDLTTDFSLSGANLTLVVAKNPEDSLVAQQYSY